jgi:acetolactate synthase-1/2/3 large subunit
VVRVKVSDYITQTLARAGIDTAFLVQGAANNDLIYSIADRSDMRYVCPMHEQAAGFMAEGYAKVKGVPGLAVGTSGPGGQNLFTAVCNFHYDSVPGIFITGQVNSQFMRQHSSLRQVGFQEWPASECFGPVTKWSITIRRPDTIRWALEKALHVCREGRPGPVVLDIPLDVQRAKIDERALEPFVPGVPKAYPLFEKVGSFLDDLSRAKRPVILVGGGIPRSAWRSLDELVALLGVPILTTWNGMDVVPTEHAWYGGRVGTYGGPGRNFAIQNCDLLLTIGCRLSGRITGGNVASFARGAKRYVVDVDPALLDPELQQQPFHVSVRCDAATFLRVLANEVRVAWAGRLPDFSTWWHKVEHWRELYDPERESNFKDLAFTGVNPYTFIKVLSNMLPGDAIVVYDTGGNAVTMGHAFRSKIGQRIFSSNGNSPMGFSLCGAMGAWFADPSRPVICIIGDGGMNLNIQELQTLKTYGIPVKTFIMNNHIYGITQQFQDTHFGGRHEASGGQDIGYVAPNFRAIAQAYGIEVNWIERANQMEAVIRTTLESKSPEVVDVVSSGFKTYEPRIAGWATPIEDMYPWLPRDEFRRNMIGVEPLPGWEQQNYGPYHG